ncbi:MAG: hypothetical protein AB1410_03895 [Acidobacteriota bacterium]
MVFISEVDQVKRELERKGVHLSESKISEYLKGIENTQQYFPFERQQSLVINLLLEWEKRKNEKILIITDEFHKESPFPSSVAIGILSSDWPGLSDTSIGIFHEKGWNIYFVKGISLVHSGEKLGLVLISLLFNAREEREKFLKEKEEILLDIKKASVGEISKTFLLSEETKKIKLYSEVIEQIQKVYKGKKLEGIIGFDGEAPKFFSARSREYIEERKIEDISYIIIRNFEMVEKVRETSELQIDIKNLWTKKGEFTGISIVWFVGNLFIEDCIRAINLVVPGFVIKYNKEFSTTDGITVLRLEIVDSDGNPLAQDIIEKIRVNLVSVILGRKYNKADLIKSVGGFEHYARAIIPFLIKEAHETKKTQVFLSVVNSSEFYIDFKILMAIYCPVKSDVIEYRCVRSLDSIEGFDVSSANPPRFYGDVELDIFDLRANLLEFSDVEEIYRKIKEKIKESVGEYRDFDEGMREMDMLKFKNVREIFKSYDEKEIRELYYSLEDFFRISASINEIKTLIEFEIEFLQKSLRNPEDIVIEAKNLYWEDGDSKYGLSIIGVSSTPKHRIVDELFEILKNYQITFSRFNRGKKSFFIFEIKKNGRKLEEDELRLLAEKISSLK